MSQIYRKRKSPEKTIFQRGKIDTRGNKVAE